jgi:hypothetical protein
MPRVVLALLVCSLVYPVALLISEGQGAAGGALLVALFTVFATVAFGVPLLAWYVRRGWFKLWQVALGGGVIGMVVSLPLGLASGARGALYFALAFAAIGVFHAVLFWLIGVWRNDEVRSLVQSRPPAAAREKERAA